MEQPIDIEFREIFVHSFFCILSIPNIFTQFFGTLCLTMTQRGLEGDSVGDSVGGQCRVSQNFKSLKMKAFLVRFPVYILT